MRRYQTKVKRRGLVLLRLGHLEDSVIILSCSQRFICPYLGLDIFNLDSTLASVDDEGQKETRLIHRGRHRAA